MNGRTANTGLNNARSSRAFKLSATTSAVRAALAVSATMLALAGSGVAYAGNCATTALNTVSCNGVFTETVPDFIVPTDDLTLILGDSAPTSVTPAPNSVGVLADWGGDITVVSHADITTVSADGVQLVSFGSDSNTFSNYGAIITDATGDSSASAIDAWAADGDVTVVNGGYILTYSHDDSNVMAVDAYSGFGLASVENLEGGSILGSSYYGNAVGVSADGGDATVTNAGSIAAASLTGNATAVDAFGYTGDATVTNTGHIEAYSLTGVTTGVEATANGNATVTNSGDIEVGGEGDATGVFASALNDGTSYVTNQATGSITATSIYNNATGIETYSFLGSTIVDNAGAISAISYEGKYAIGIDASAYGDTTVINSGSITAEGFVAIGVYAYSLDGLAAVTNSEGGSINAESIYGDAIGVYAVSTNGSVNITNSGDIAAISYDTNASGIRADANGYASSYPAYSNVVITNSGSVSGVVQADIRTRLRLWHLRRGTE